MNWDLFFKEYMEGKVMKIDDQEAEWQRITEVCCNKEITITLEKINHEHLFSIYLIDKPKTDCYILYKMAAILPFVGFYT